MANLSIMTSEARIDEIVTKLFQDIRFPEEPAGLYEPLRYMIRIGGKRIRPRLCLTTYFLYRDYVSEEILEPAAALEVFHTFTLIHDDIMDCSPLRRGMPTVWKKWGNDTAILSGDVMLIDAYKRIAKAPHFVADQVVDLFSKTAAEVCEGQQYDMEFENLPEVSMSEYERMIGLKTAVLLACSAEMGAMIAGAPEEVCEALYGYGYELGMAFQVADDYLDAFGDSLVFGKPIGGDIVENKKSWLLLKALEKIDDKQRLFDLMSLPVDTPERRAEKIARVKAVYEELGVAADARTEVERFSSRAIDAVRDLRLGQVRRETLCSFADKLVGRAK